jgi:hypothetical protein
MFGTSNGGSIPTLLTMKLECKKWYISLDTDGFSIGLGWWEDSYILFVCDNIYYDGNWWSFRLGPLFICRGPY